MVSQQWRAEEPAVKEYWTTLAAEENRKHKEKYPGYKYCAQRPIRDNKVTKTRSSRGRGSSESPSKQVLSPEQMNPAYAFAARDQVSPAMQAQVQMPTDIQTPPNILSDTQMQMQMPLMDHTAPSMLLDPQTYSQFADPTFQTSYQAFLGVQDYQVLAPTALPADSLADQGAQMYSELDAVQNFSLAGDLSFLDMDIDMNTGMERGLGTDFTM